MPGIDTCQFVVYRFWSARIRLLAHHNSFLVADRQQFSLVCKLKIHSDTESPDLRSQLAHSMNRSARTTRSCHNLTTSLKERPAEHSSRNDWHKLLPTDPLPHESLTNTREVSSSWRPNWTMHTWNKAKYDALKRYYALGIDTVMKKVASIEFWLVPLHAERKQSQHGHLASDTTCSPSKQRSSHGREDTHTFTEKTHTHTDSLANPHAYSSFPSKDSSRQIQCWNAKCQLNNLPWFPSNHDMTNNCKATMNSCANYVCSENDGQPTAVELDTTQSTESMMRPTMYTRSHDSGTLSRCYVE